MAGRLKVKWNSEQHHPFTFGTINTLVIILGQFEGLKQIIKISHTTTYKEAIFGFMQSCSCLSCRISCSTAPGVMCTLSAHRLHIIRTSSMCHLRMRICCPHQDTSSAHCLQAICTTPHGHRGPELSFTVTGICY